MTEHKARWINYMLLVIKPEPGLLRACTEMLSERYDAAFNEGKHEAYMDKE